MLSPAPKKILFLAVVACLELSCTNNSYKKIISSYSVSTLNGSLDRYYIALPVSIGKVDASGYKIEEEKGFIVCRGLLLYNYLYKKKISEENFANYLLALLVREQELIITKEEYNIIQSHIISKSDGEKYKQIKLKTLLKKYAKNGFLPGIHESNPNYEGRCIIYSFLTKGASVTIEDESGYLYIGRIR